jgi:hypothetical protein
MSFHVRSAAFENSIEIYYYYTGLCQYFLYNDDGAQTVNTQIIRAVLHPRRYNILTAHRNGSQQPALDGLLNGRFLCRGNVLLLLLIFRDRIYMHKKSSKYASKNAVIRYKICIYF